MSRSDPPVVTPARRSFFAEPAGPPSSPAPSPRPPADSKSGTPAKRREWRYSGTTGRRIGSDSGLAGKQESVESSSPRLASPRIVSPQSAEKEPLKEQSTVEEQNLKLSDIVCRGCDFRYSDLKFGGTARIDLELHAFGVLEREAAASGLPTHTHGSGSAYKQASAEKKRLQKIDPLWFTAPRFVDALRQKLFSRTRTIGLRDQVPIGLRDQVTPSVSRSRSRSPRGRR